MVCNPTYLFPVGVHCEINLDDCNPSRDPLTNEPKCFNNGKCVDRIGGYQCVCPPGYVGERCEGDVNECLSDPCDPRGSYNCIQLTNSYRCECRTGYTGTECGSAAKVQQKSKCFLRVADTCFLLLCHRPALWQGIWWLQRATLQKWGDMCCCQ